MRVLLLLPCLLVAAVVGAPESSAQAEWNLMIYLNGDNNLENCAVNDFLEMASVGSTADVNVLVQLDRKPGYNSLYGDWTDARRFRITPGLTPDPGNELAILGEINCGQGVETTPGDGSLEDFVRWACTTYRARKNAIILWNHGFGWRAAGDD